MIKTLKLLLNEPDNEKTEEEKNKEIEKLAVVLGLKVGVLKSCKKNNITKTCRQVIKEMFPISRVRAKKSISIMPRIQKEAIRGNYRIREYNSS